MSEGVKPETAPEPASKPKPGTRAQQFRAALNERLSTHGVTYETQKPKLAAYEALVIVGMLDFSGASISIPEVPVAEVKIATSAEEANAMLVDGWQFVSGNVVEGHVEVLMVRREPHPKRVGPMTDPEKDRAFAHYTALAAEAEAREHIVVTGNTISHPLPPVVPDRIGVRRDAGPREARFGTTRVPNEYPGGYEDACLRCGHDDHGHGYACTGTTQYRGADDCACSGSFDAPPRPDAPARRAQCDGAEKGL